MRLKVSPIFGALTRPAMTGGVTFEYHGLNLVFSMGMFILMGDLLYGLVFVPIHAFGWLAHRHDSQFFKVTFKAFSMPSMPNKHLRGVRHYGPY